MVFKFNFMQKNEIPNNYLANLEHPLFQDLHGPVGPQASKLAKISKNEKFFWCPSLKNTQILTMSSALGSILCSTWKTQNFGCPQIFNSQHFLPWPPVSEKM